MSTMPRAYKKKSEEEKEHNGWCFTINNPKFSDCGEIDKLIPMAKYMIVGNEHAWTNGKPKPDGTHHFQCYINFKRSQKFVNVEKLLTRAKIIKADGEAVDNQKYCSKEGDFKEWGTCPMSRKRKGEAGEDAVQEKWRKIRKLAEEGKWVELEKKYLFEFSRYKRELYGIGYDACEDLPPQTNVGIWIYGPPGTRKTHYAINNMETDRSKVYIKDMSKWWDGFKPGVHEHVVINITKKFKMANTRNLRSWSHNFAFPAEYRGGTFKIRPRWIVVTSNYRICDIWKDKESRDSFYWRFKSMIKLTPEDPPIEDVDYKKEN
jgi:hypothetical protein